jgi:hypothetical protein
MSQSSQSAASHTRWDPLFHFALAPTLLVNFFVQVKNFIGDSNFDNAWGIILGAALVILVLKVRSNPLRVQDRLIRLEERLRMQSILKPELQSRITELSEKQLVALRFASDGELNDLVPKVLEKQMEPKDIKQAIRQWRPDNFRV